VSVVSPTTQRKKKVALYELAPIIPLMAIKQLYSERELAAVAKQIRVAAGKNRSQAARELDVARPSLIHAEDYPEKTFIKLRTRIIEKYSQYKVVGPLFRLERK
jgi:DNA-binding XRE family transcriptional regulator